MTLGEALTAAKEKLVLNSVPSPYLNAEVLLQRLLGVEKVFLMAHPEKELAVDVEQKYLDWVERRARGEPAQYPGAARSTWACSRSSPRSHPSRWLRGGSPRGTLT